MPTTPSPPAPLDQVPSTQKLDQLVAAIRDPATTMEDLTHMVGPDPVDAETQATRLLIIDGLWARAKRLSNRWGNDPESWPTRERDLYRDLMDDCRAFESRYC